MFLRTTNDRLAYIILRLGLADVDVLSFALDSVVVLADAMITHPRAYTSLE